MLNYSFRLSRNMDFGKVPVGIYIGGTNLAAGPAPTDASLK
jgi:hypothetical protein